MHEKKAIPLAAVAVLAVLLGTVIHQSAVYGAPSSKPPSPRPILTVKVSSHMCKANEVVDVWFYITNPSTDMETDDGISEPIHKVEVHSISVECITPDGTRDVWFFEPPSPSSQLVSAMGGHNCVSDGKIYGVLHDLGIPGRRHLRVHLHRLGHIRRRNLLHPAYFQS